MISFFGFLLFGMVEVYDLFAFERFSFVGVVIWIDMTAGAWYTGVFVLRFS
jgi:hypothetical protein